jgi:hypothetical protein
VPLSRVRRYVSSLGARCFACKNATSGSLASVSATLDVGTLLFGVASLDLAPIALKEKHAEGVCGVIYRHSGERSPSASRDRRTVKSNRLLNRLLNRLSVLGRDAQAPDCLAEGFRH